MQTITEILLEKDPTLSRHDEGFWQDPYRALPGKYSSFNDAGIECETGEFLYSLVRLLKPYYVLETGTHWGIGASYMGLALQENGQGELDTVEFLPEIHVRAVQRIISLDLQEIVSCHLMDVAGFEPREDRAGKYGLILLDTEPQTRFAELEKFYKHLAYGGFMFIHDLHRGMGQNSNNPDHPGEPHWPYGAVTEFMKEKVKSGELRPFHFATPRGLTGFYKVHPEDYKWE